MAFGKLLSLCLLQFFVLQSAFAVDCRLIDNSALQISKSVIENGYPFYPVSKSLFPFTEYGDQVSEVSIWEFRKDTSGNPAYNFRVTFSDGSKAFVSMGQFMLGNKFKTIHKIISKNVVWNHPFFFDWREMKISSNNFVTIMKELSKLDLPSFVQYLEFPIETYPTTDWPCLYQVEVK